MDDVIIAGRDDERDLFKLFTTHYAAPAYIRRAKGVQEAFDQLVERCRMKREELIPMVRSRLGVLQGLAGERQSLLPYLADPEQIGVLERLTALVEPKVCTPVARTSSGRALRCALAELNESLARFNHRWEACVREVKLDEVNERREGYNRYYILEKECAIRSPTLARQGFQHLEPLTHADLFEVLPPLPLVKLRLSAFYASRPLPTRAGSRWALLDDSVIGTIGRSTS